ncbi:MAG: 50S ribosomal protein L21 [Terriglobales bacterium]
MYAVIRSGGKQYRVSPGDEFELERLPQAAGETVTFADVLAVQDAQGQLQAGEGARVTARVLAQGKAGKILVFHYKRKKQYKKLQGHRQLRTRVRIEAIQAQ